MFSYTSSWIALLNCPYALGYSLGSPLGFFSWTSSGIAFLDCLIGLPLWIVFLHRLFGQHSTFGLFSWNSRLDRSLGLSSWVVLLDCVRLAWSTLVTYPYWLSAMVETWKSCLSVRSRFLSVTPDTGEFDPVQQQINYFRWNFEFVFSFRALRRALRIGYSKHSYR